MGGHKIARRTKKRLFNLIRGLGRVRPGADVTDREHAKGLLEEPGDIAGAVVGHHPLDPDAALLEPAERPHEEAGGGGAPLVRQHLHVGEPGGIVDGDMEEVVAGAFACSPPVASDAVADPLEAGELLDVEMQELARPLALIAAHRRGLVQALEASEPAPLQPGGDSGACQLQLRRDLFGGEPIIPPQALHHVDPGIERAVGDRLRPRGAVLKPRRPGLTEAGQPLARRPLAHAKAGRHVSDRPPLLDDAPHHLRSTKRCHPGILMRVVHPCGPQ